MVSKSGANNPVDSAYGLHRVRLDFFGMYNNTGQVPVGQDSYQGHVS